MRAKEVTFFILFLLATLIITNLYWLQQQQQNNTLYQQASQLAEERATLQQTISRLEQQAAEKPPVIEKPVYIEKIVEVQPALKSQRYPILAYSRKNQEGVVGHVEVSLLPGKGDILIDIKPFNALEVQRSAGNAVDAALKHLGIRRLTDKDIKIEFEIDAQAVGGESAGLAIGIATVALLTNRKVQHYVAATGTLDAQGNVGKVGGILAKAEAISKKGATVLLIPRGEGEIMAVTPHYITDETGKIIRKEENVLRPINVIREARNRWSLDVIQVATLTEALDKALAPKS